MRHYFDVETLDGVAVVKFKSKLDDANIHDIGEQLFRLVEETGQHRLQLDLGNVDYLGSVGLAKFVALHKKLRGVGGHLTLSNVAGSVYAVFEVTNLHKLLDVRRKAAG